jgi:hypothetical protein
VRRQPYGYMSASASQVTDGVTSTATGGADKVWRPPHGYRNASAIRGTENVTSPDLIPCRPPHPG